MIGSDPLALPANALQTTLGKRGETGMNHLNGLRQPTALVLVLVALALADCASEGTPELATGPSSPPAFQSQDIVGGWGIGAYLKEEDRARTELAAADQCMQPYQIAPGPTGGVMMHLGSQDKVQELRVKGGPGGKTYIGPEGPPGGWLDREVISFDGRILILRWADPKVRDQYGATVYVRCPPEGAKPKAKPKARSKRV